MHICQSQGHLAHPPLTLLENVQVFGPVSIEKSTEFELCLHADFWELQILWHYIPNYVQVQPRYVFGVLVSGGLVKFFYTIRIENATRQRVCGC